MDIYFERARVSDSSQKVDFNVLSTVQGHLMREREREKEREREREKQLTFGTELVFFLLFACSLHASITDKSVGEEE